eukprot:189205-Pyramimonas_sp.AAC.1
MVGNKRWTKETPSRLLVAGDAIKAATAPAVGEGPSRKIKAALTEPGACELLVGRSAQTLAHLPEVVRVDAT